MHSAYRRIVSALFASLLVLTASSFAADKPAPQRPIAANQTEGFGDGQLLVFSYFQNFACIHEPFDDLNHNGTVAALDATEFQRPVCVVGHQPTIEPTGEPIKQVEKLYVIVPFFGQDTNPNDAFNPALGNALISLFGTVPEAFRAHPTVDVQCPEPGNGITQHAGAPGTCTMHTNQLDLGPVLASLGKVPPNTNVFLPTVNHSHIIEGKNFGAIWWQVVTVLVTDPSAWPDLNGTKGMTSVDALRAAQKAGKATADVPTNFFLFFDSRQEHGH
jgi:hypothetical protein